MRVVYSLLAAEIARSINEASSTEIANAATVQRAVVEDLLERVEALEGDDALEATGEPQWFPDGTDALIAGALANSPTIVAPTISGQLRATGSSGAEPVGRKVSDFFSKTGLSDGTAVDFFEVTVLNTTCGAGVIVRAAVSLGDGSGAATALYTISVSRIEDADTQVSVSTLAADSKTSSPGLVPVLAVSVTGLTGADDATQTFVIQASVDVESGSTAGGHFAALEVDLLDLKSGSVSIST